MKHFVKKYVAVWLMTCCLVLSEIGSLPVYALETTETDEVPGVPSDEQETEGFGEPAVTADGMTADDGADSETANDGILTDESRVSETSEAEETVMAAAQDTVEEAEPTEETETIEDVHTITGFVGLDAYSSRLDGLMADKPPLEELLAEMPETLAVYLDGSSEVTAIPVTWFCVGDDYETSTSHYFQFSPSFDESVYTLAEDMDLMTEAPYIGVFLAEGNGVSTLSVTSNSNETVIFEFLVNEMGFNQAAGSGILANIYCESGFDPGVDGDSGSSYGICQWYGSRKTNLINFCKEHGYDYTTVTGQLYFLEYELTTSYTTIYNYMMNVANTADGAYDAGYYWCKNFEIPADTENRSVTRGNLARDTYWPEYGSTDVTPVLGAPIVSVAYGASEGLVVSWNQISRADGYRVYRKTNGGSWERIAIVSDGSVLSYTDKDVSGGTTYTYTVRATSGSEMSSYESQVQVVYLDSPQMKSAQAVSDGVKVTWDKVAGAEGYRIYRKTGSSGWTRIAVISGGSATSYIDEEVSSGSTYTYTVRATAGGSLSNYDSQTKLLYLEDPDITGVSNGSGSVKVSWEKITGASGYRVYRKTGSSGWTRIADISGGETVSCTDKDVSSGTTYTYTVRAYAGSSMSIYEDQEKIVYLSVPSLSGTSGSAAGIKVSWQKVSGASGYNIYRKVSGGSWSRVARVSGGSTVVWTDDTAAADTTYIYTVRAYNGSSLSDYNRAGLSGKYTVTLVKYTTTEKLNYRTGPGTDYATVGTLSKGTTVQVVSGYSTTANGYTWYKIYLNGSYYYAVANYLKKA